MNTTNVWVEDGVEVAPPAWYRRGNRYGSVLGLDDEELASPEELERIQRIQEWEPVLLLPKPRARASSWAWDRWMTEDEGRLWYRRLIRVGAGW